MSRLWTILAAGLFLAGLTLTNLAPAHADDLDRFIERDKIAAEKILHSAGKAIRSSLEYEKSFPARAAAELEKSIAEVGGSPLLAAEVKAEWLGRLNGRLRRVNETMHAFKVAVEEKGSREAAEALRKDREEGFKKGSGVSGTAKAYIGSIADQVAAADRLRKVRESDTMSVFSGIDATRLAIAGDGYIEYPKHWDRISSSKYRGSGKTLHPKEVALLKTLNSTMPVNFEMRRFREVLDYMQEKTGLAIIVDKGSLEDAGIDYDDPVNFKVPSASVRTILKKILADRNLTYIIKEGTLQVMTPNKAREMMVVRAYPVNDLLGGGDPRFGPYVNRAAMAASADGLIKMIQTAIDPGIWDINGGTASITFYEPTLSLLIRAPAELHYMMGSGSLFR